MNDFQTIIACNTECGLDDLHYVEPYNPNKKYVTEKYEFNYGHGKRTYRNKLYLLPSGSYVGATEVLPDNMTDEQFREKVAALLNTP